MPLQSCIFFFVLFRACCFLTYSLATWQTRLFYNPRQLRSQMEGVSRWVADQQQLLPLSRRTTSSHVAFNLFFPSVEATLHLFIISWHEQNDLGVSYLWGSNTHIHKPIVFSWNCVALQKGGWGLKFIFFFHFDLRQNGYDTAPPVCFAYFCPEPSQNQLESNPGSFLQQTNTANAPFLPFPEMCACVT